MSVRSWSTPSVTSDRGPESLAGRAVGSWNRGDAAPTLRPRREGGKPRLVRVAALSKAGVAGANKVVLSRRALKPGTYTLRAIVAGSSLATTFTITAR
jgi:hypothetical protein